MESINGIYIPFFSSFLFSIILVFVLGFFLIIWWIRKIFNRREIHNRLLEIAFEKGLMNEKYRSIQQKLFSK